MRRASRVRMMMLAAWLCGAGGWTVVQAAPIECANLIFGGTQTSRCFSDEFLSALQRQTTIAAERRFRSVKLASEELFGHPLIVMTGETDFRLSQQERTHLKRYLESGGFLVASAGCSSKDFDRAFRRELRSVFEQAALEKLAFEHPIYHTVFPVTELKLKHPSPGATLEGMTLNGKTVVVYSAHGLNNTQSIDGCCCCGGNEILNAMELNANLVAYALLY